MSQKRSSVGLRLEQFFVSFYEDDMLPFHLRSNSLFCVCKFLAELADTENRAFNVNQRILRDTKTGNRSWASLNQNLTALNVNR
jgi:hypothetical protein